MQSLIALRAGAKQARVFPSHVCKWRSTKRFTEKRPSGFESTRWWDEIDPVAWDATWQEAETFGNRHSHVEQRRWGA